MCEHIPEGLWTEATGQVGRSHPRAQSSSRGGGGSPGTSSSPRGLCHDRLLPGDFVFKSPGPAFTL